MLEIFKNETKPDFDAEIVTLINALKDLPAGTDDYNNVLRNITELTRARQTFKDGDITRSQILASLTSVSGILMVLHYESVHVIASKAFGLIGKLKI